MSDVEPLLVALLERVERDGDPGAALEELCREHPDQARTLRRRVALLADLGVLRAPEAERAPERLGPFRLLRPLGGGGMGVVWLAEEEGLGREVALKVIRPEHLFFPGARERFRREVETVARLHHPAIVPVYRVGEEGGVPYFAMERVVGCSLDEVLRDLRGRGADPAALTGRDLAEAVARHTPDADVDPGEWLFAGSWEAACLRVLRQVAEALEHAHRRGVVHRDLKPSNVMVTVGEGGSQARLVDFGLASSRGAGELTRTGSRLGSLAYMAPEQARGAVDEVGPATDVYALGVTLYELLTLQRPFAGDGDAELLLAIRRGDARPPRERNPALSWEAATVCLTAMDPDPARRYGSAADLARDLGAVLEHRPIEARRAGPALRARRWAQRHPTAAVAAPLLLLLLVGTPLFFLWREREAAREIRGHLERSQESFARALEAVDTMLTRVGDEELRFVPQMAPVRRALLEDAVAFARSLLGSGGDDFGARLSEAQAHARLGDLLNELGEYDEGLAHQAEARALFDRLLAERPGDDALRAARADVASRRAIALREAGRRDEAEAAHAEVDALLEARLAAHPADRGTRLDLAQNATSLGLLRAEELALADADAAFGRAVALLEDVVREAPDDVAALQQLGAARSAWAQGVLSSEEVRVDPERVRAMMEGAIDAFARAVALEPQNPRHVWRLQIARINLAGLLKRTGAYAQADEVARAAVAPLERLVADHPTTYAFALELASACNQVGSVADWQGRHADAEPWYARAVEQLRALVTRLPDLPTLRNRLGIAELNLGAKRMALGAHAEAEPHLRAAVEQQREARRLDPGQRVFAQDQRASHQALTDVLLEQGDHLAAAQEAHALVEAMPEDWESYSRAGSLLARCVAVARRDPALSDEQRRACEEAYVARVVAYLREALARGFPHGGQIATEPVFAPLRGTPAFDALLAELRSP